MDPRERAEAILARARARGSFVVTPDSAISPMDAAATIQIPRRLVADADRFLDPESTAVVAIPDDELPAIVQEAATQSLASPGRPAARDREYQDLEGVIPTVGVPRPTRSRLSDRLDGREAP